MQNVVLVRNPQSEIVLMHSGVKGMKWGVRRNLKKAERATKSLKNDAKEYDHITKSEKVNTAIAGKKGNSARLALANKSSRMDDENRRSIDSHVTTKSIDGNRALNKAASKNAKHLSKLQAKANKTGKAKDIQNYKNYQALSKTIESRVNSQRRDISDAYKDTQKSRNEIFKERQNRAKVVGDGIFGKGNPRPDMNAYANNVTNDYGQIWKAYRKSLAAKNAR